MICLNNVLMPKRALYMPSHTYLLEGLSSQLTSGAMSFTTMKQSFQNLWSMMIEARTLLLLLFEYLESTKNLVVTKACKSCLWSWRLFNAMNVVAKWVAPRQENLCPSSSFSQPTQRDYTQICHLWCTSCKHINMIQLTNILKD